MHNALRHSLISNRFTTIQNVQQVALEAGNTPEMFLQHYVELVTAKSAAAWFAITPETAKAYADAHPRGAKYR
jgi:hypothetical protein